MNKTIHAALSAFALMTMSAFGFDISSDAANVKTGEWNDQTDAVLDKAEAEHIPVVIVGTAAGCICDG